MIESAFELLEILRALGRARLTELTAESTLPRTTVYRLLGQLTAVGAVERIGAQYRLFWPSANTSPRWNGCAPSRSGR